MGKQGDPVANSDPPVGATAPSREGQGGGVMSKQLEAVAQAIEALAKPINESAMVQVQVFHELAEAARAAEETSKAIQQLREAVVETGRQVESMVSIMQNYIESNKALRLDARRAIQESESLRSAVREKLG